MGVRPQFRFSIRCSTVYRRTSSWPILPKWKAEDARCPRTNSYPTFQNSPNLSVLRLQMFPQSGSHRIHWWQRWTFSTLWYNPHICSDELRFVTRFQTFMPWGLPKFRKCWWFWAFQPKWANRKRMCLQPWWSKDLQTQQWMLRHR